MNGLKKPDMMIEREFCEIPSAYSSWILFVVLCAAVMFSLIQNVDLRTPTSPDAGQLSAVVNYQNETDDKTPVSHTSTCDWLAIVAFKIDVPQIGYGDDPSSHPAHSPVVSLEQSNNKTLKSYIDDGYDTPSIALFVSLMPGARELSSRVPPNRQPDFIDSLKRLPIPPRGPPSNI